LKRNTFFKERRQHYRDLLRATIPEGEWMLIREAVQRGHLSGPDRFVEQVATRLGKRI
jgi:putative transposase